MVAVLTKRTTTFERRERDFYPTPLAPVERLARAGWWREGYRFVEPCVGEGDLRRHLESLGGVCTWASDLPNDARELPAVAAFGAHFIITNPPWPMPRDASVTLDIIRRCMSLLPSWFLLSADFAHNAYFRPFADQCGAIVSAGRVQWIPGSAHTSLDNCAWYLFSAAATGGPKFYNV
jgi:hypothetical protein